MSSSHFWPFARRLLKHPWLVGPALVFAVLSAGGLGAGLLGIGPVLDAVLKENPAGLPELTRDLNTRLAPWGVAIPESIIAGLPPGPFDAVLWIIVGLGALTLIGATCNFMHAYLALTAISRTIANIRTECFRQVVHLPLRSVIAAGPSDLVSRIVYDTQTLASGFNALLSRAVAQATKGLVAVLVAVAYDWRLAAAAIAVAPVLGIIIRKLGKRIRRASKRALESQSALYLIAGEVLGGLRVVKVHTSERQEMARFNAMNAEVVRQELRVRTARALAGPLVETIAIVVLGGLFLIAVKAIIDGHLDKTRSLLVLGSLGMAAAQLKPLTALMTDMQQSSAAAARLGNLLGLSFEPGHDDALPALPRHRDSIEFDNVTFAYAGASTPSVRALSLKIRHGQTVAIVGPNGSGKTTLLSLVPRLFDPDDGRVLIDGADLRTVNLDSLRAQIGVVTQETVLFRGTIRDNIAYGVPGGAAAAGEARIAAAARAARAEQFILAKPGGYDFVIGEQGSGLSGGQRQRLAIARAILRDPAILILDEATSMIDAESEAAIAEAIAEFLRGSGRDTRPRTCLVVAHRLSTVVSADLIVVMDHGQIVDMGTHAALLERSDLYRTLAQHQLIAAAASPSHTAPSTPSA